MSYRVEKWDSAEAPKTARLRILMESDGYEVYEWSDRPGSVYGMHEHSDDQSHCIISGKLELTVMDEGALFWNPATAILCPPEHGILPDR
jgi:quercetin dioxygenase-like cupin family protein